MRKHVHAESQKSYFLKYQNMRFLKKFQMLKSQKEQVPNFPKNFWTFGTDSSQ